MRPNMHTNLRAIRCQITDAKGHFTHTGWNVAIPAFEATAPAIKGTRADPAWPDLAIEPIAPV